MDLRQPLPAALLAGVSALVARRIGLHFPPERGRDIERGIAAAAREFGHPDAESCARALLSAPLTQTQLEVLASHLTVGETYFFRDKKCFEALEEYILPELLRSRRGSEQRLRIWSAGCCTGEEPYSVAMLLDRLIPDIEKWNVTLLASDINPHFLRKAAAGEYGEWSFRDPPGWIRERYFTRRRNGRYELLPRIRKMVTLSHLNLADDAYPSLTSNTNAMDVILCRNVLMYFSPERARQVATNFHRALLNGGWLIVSPTETSNSLFAPLSEVPFPGIVFYRKGGAAAPRPVAFEEPPPALQVPLLPELVAPWVELPQAATTVEATPPQVPPPDTPGEYVHAARRCAGEGRLGEAIEWCEKTIAADKLNPAHYYLLAIIQQEQAQLDAAARSLARALYLDADFVLADFALGNLRLSQGRQRDAERHFANALAVLRTRAQDEILPESDGLTVGRLADIIVSVRAARHAPRRDEKHT
jgi:chemotaxis protein methyltransferase CheR